MISSVPPSQLPPLSINLPLSPLKAQTLATRELHTSHPTRTRHRHVACHPRVVVHGLGTLGAAAGAITYLVILFKVIEHGQSNHARLRSPRHAAPPSPPMCSTFSSDAAADAPAPASATSISAAASAAAAAAAVSASRCR